MIYFFLKDEDVPEYIIKTKGVVSLKFGCFCLGFKWKSTWYIFAFGSPCMNSVGDGGHATFIGAPTVINKWNLMGFHVPINNRKD